MWWHALVRTTKNFWETSSCSVDDPVTLCSMTVSCNSNLPNHINNHYHFFIRKYNNLLFSVFSKPHAHNKACIVKNQLRTHWLNLGLQRFTLHYISECCHLRGFPKNWFSLALEISMKYRCIMKVKVERFRNVYRRWRFKGSNRKKEDF